MRLMIGAPMTYAREPPATIHATAFALFSNGKCSPISVKVIGVTAAVASPTRE